MGGMFQRIYRTKNTLTGGPCDLKFERGNLGGKKKKADNLSIACLWNLAPSLRSGERF